MCVNKFYSCKNEIIFQYEPTEGRAIDKLKLAHNYSGGVGGGGLGCMQLI